MTPIDWRELYASNLAAIEAGRGMSVPPRPTMPRPSKPKLPKGIRVPRRVEPPRRPPRDDRPSGTGRWHPQVYDGPAGKRAYCLYTPRDLSTTSAAPLVVMLHGCTQGPADLARGTAMNLVADRHGFVVAYPHQTTRQNPQGCWNWYLERHQGRGAGEPALLAGLTREVMASRPGAGIDPQRVFLAGMSAGGAMAAVMAATHPELFAGVGVHSGLAYGSATNQEGAFRAMAEGGAGGGKEVVEAMGSRMRLVPSIVVHGTGDHIVSPANGDHLVEQWLAANRLSARGAFDDAELERPGSREHGQVEGGHAYTRYRWSDRDGRLVQEYLKVKGLGHAWSGGDRAGSYADPKGPDASRAMWEFFAGR